MHDHIETKVVLKTASAEENPSALAWRTSFTSLEVESAPSLPFGQKLGLDVSSLISHSVGGQPFRGLEFYEVEVVYHETKSSEASEATVNAGRSVSVKQNDIGFDFEGDLTSLINQLALIPNLGGIVVRLINDELSSEIEQGLLRAIQRHAFPTINVVAIHVKTDVLEIVEVHTLNESEHTSTTISHVRTRLDKLSDVTVLKRILNLPNVETLILDGPVFANYEFERNILAVYLLKNLAPPLKKIALPLDLLTMTKAAMNALEHSSNLSTIELTMPNHYVFTDSDMIELENALFNGVEKLSQLLELIVPIELQHFMLLESLLERTFTCCKITEDQQSTSYFQRRT